MATGPEQRTLDFNLIEFTDEERACFRCQIDRWTIEGEMDAFQKLPRGTVAEYLTAREIHLMGLEAFGPNFKREPKISKA